MATMQPERLLTAEEFFELPKDDGRYELVEGRLVRMPPEFFSASMIAMTLARIVSTFVHIHKLGICGGEAGGVRTKSGPDTVRAPDFTFISNDRLPPGGIPLRWYPTAADLVVEVLSPTDRFVNVLRKVQEYLAAGVRLVWVINPSERSAVVFRPSTPPEIITDDGALDGEDVLPGFRLPLADLWEGLAPEDAQQP